MSSAPPPAAEQLQVQQNSPRSMAGGFLMPGKNLEKNYSPSLIGVLASLCLHKVTFHLLLMYSLMIDKYSLSDF
jgi:hypothetical protein